VSTAAIDRLRKILALCKELRIDLGVAARCERKGIAHEYSLGHPHAAIVTRDIEHAEHALQQAIYAAQNGDLCAELDRRQQRQDEQVRRELTDADRAQAKEVASRA
jgi:hypothetical protein